MDALDPTDVRRLLDSGVAPPQVADRLVATGAWSPGGAKEIVSFLTSGPDVLLKAGVAGTGKRKPVGRAAVATLRGRHPGAP
jgi:hypothetical protein